MNIPFTRLLHYDYVVRRLANIVKVSFFDLQDSVMGVQ